jgi:hypothetical protein
LPLRYLLHQERQDKSCQDIYIFITITRWNSSLRDIISLEV